MFIFLKLAAAFPKEILHQRGAFLPEDPLCYFGLWVEWPVGGVNAGGVVRGCDGGG